MVVDPSDIPLPPSRAAPTSPLFCLPTPGLSHLIEILPVVDRPISPDTQAILEYFQQQATIPKYGRYQSSPPDDSIPDLQYALAEMFGLEPLPIQQLDPDRSPRHMDTHTLATAWLFKRRSTLPIPPTIPATRCYSPDPDSPEHSRYSKQHKLGHYYNLYKYGD
jgi:hypothetical protein